MITPEASKHAKGRLEQPNPEEVKEINFKRNLMKIWRPLNRK